MRKLVLGLALAAVAAVPVAAASSGSLGAERTCYTPHVGGFDSFEVCHYLPIDLEPSGATVVAQPQVPGLPGLPDPSDCHSMQQFFGIQNVVSCDGPPVE